MSKKTKIKIKRSKVNLYNKKKNKKKRALTVVITVVAACALAVLGFGIGKALSEYFSSKNEENSSELSSETVSSQDEESSQTASSSEAENSSETPPVVVKDKPFVISAESAKTREGLDAALARAKADGCTVAVVTMKDSDGYFSYKTEIKHLDPYAKAGALTAAEIVRAVKDAGLKPAARFSTLKDPLNGVWLGAHYTLADGTKWIDGRLDKGGKSWLSPFNEKAVNFVADISAELSAAGFEQIIAFDTCYPKFFYVDINEYLEYLPIEKEEKTARAAALWRVLKEAKDAAGSAEFIIETDAAALVEEFSEIGGSVGEIANLPDEIKNSALWINYSPEEGANYAELARRLKKAVNGAKCEIYLTCASAEAENALKNAGFEVTPPISR